jgi:heme-degrading monooxygenase HmoA
MIVVVFEVTMKDGQGPRYFDLAASLRPELERIDGFLSVERFQSLATPGKYVSISFWRDAAAVDAWRAHAGHGAAQRLGKTEVFADFRITVAEAIRSYTLAERRSR